MEVSGLVLDLDSQPGSELPFATPVNQIELHECLALRVFEDTVQGWVYDIAFFLRVGLCRRFINKTA